LACCYCYIVKELFLFSARFSKRERKDNNFFLFASFLEKKFFSENSLEGTKVLLLLKPQKNVDKI